MKKKRPSLLDQLLPSSSLQSSKQVSTTVLAEQDYKRSVQRDIQFLLSSINLSSSIDLKSFPQVAKSVLNYGMPDHTGLTQAILLHEDFQRELREVLVTFEPRLIPSSIHIIRQNEIDETSESAVHGMVQFKIEAQIYMDPAPLYLELLSELDVNEGRLRLLF